MADGYIQVAPDGSGKLVDNNVFQRSGQDIYRQRVEVYTGERIDVSLPSMAMTVSGFNRVAALTTLFDGKHLVADDTFKWDTAGTGTANFSNNAMTMTVTSGQYHIRQAKHWCPYFSGKPQLIEATSFNFQLQAGVIKRVGYFSSSAVAPYTGNLDGLYLESDGVNMLFRLVTVNNGVETHNIPWTDWDNYSLISGYDWSKFTVSEFDFLWLGGAGLRYFPVIDGAFKLTHVIDNHAGYKDTLIFNSPNQPVRYEIRGVSGGGSFTEVCSQVASEGAQAEEGEELSVYSAPLACNAVGTIYALKGVRKSATYRNSHIDISSASASIAAATTDSGVLLLILNPTLSAPLTWTANSRIEEGTATTQTITAGTGRILACIPMNNSGNASVGVTSGLRSLPININNTAGQVILAYQPTTINQNVTGQISVVEY